MKSQAFVLPKHLEPQNQITSVQIQSSDRPMIGTEAQYEFRFQVKLHRALSGTGDTEYFTRSLGSQPVTMPMAAAQLAILTRPENFMRFAKEMKIERTSFYYPSPSMDLSDAAEERDRLQRKNQIANELAFKREHISRFERLLDIAQEMVFNDRTLCSDPSRLASLSNDFLKAKDEREKLDASVAHPQPKQTPAPGLRSRGPRI